MQLFYLPDINGNTITLPEEESKHCIRVLRMASGDELLIVNGKGSLFTCKITDANPKRCVAKVVGIKNKFEKRNFLLHIAIAPTKNIDRFEWFLEKATEIGVDRITPLLCKHSERKTVNMERLVRVSIAAMKQSVKAYLPDIQPITPINTVIQAASESIKLIAYCGEFNNAHAASYIEKGKSILFLIGPEGDFSQDEVELALGNGFHIVSLGSSRLRTETAGIVSCTLVNMLNNFSLK